MPNGVSSAAAAACGVFCLVPALLVRIERRVARGQAEIGGALEHRQVIRLRGDARDHLHAGRAGADHADAQAGEIDALVRPQTAVVPLALERLQTLEVGHARGREIAARHDAERRGHHVALVGPDRPAVGRGIEFSGGRRGY